MRQKGGRREGGVGGGGGDEEPSKLRAEKVGRSCLSIVVTWRLPFLIYAFFFRGDILIL